MTPSAHLFVGSLPSRRTPPGHMIPSTHRFVGFLPSRRTPPGHMIPSGRPHDSLNQSFRRFPSPRRTPPGHMTPSTHLFVGFLPSRRTPPGHTIPSTHIFVGFLPSRRTPLGHMSPSSRPDDPLNPSFRRFPSLKAHPIRPNDSESLSHLFVDFLSSRRTTPGHMIPSSRPPDPLDPSFRRFPSLKAYPARPHDSLKQATLLPQPIFSSVSVPRGAPRQAT
jgi:hypothetical protein